MTQIDPKTPLKQLYEEKVLTELLKDMGETNPMMAPKITKIVVNMGTQDALKDKNISERLVEDLSTITGQKPKVQNARISVAGFGIREGNPVALSVTLRGKKMYAFLEKFIRIVLPRLRDFRGVSLKSFDHHGNYTVGINDYTVFPQIDLAKVTRRQGLEVTIVTNTKDAKLAKQLLEKLGMPFEKEE